MRRRAIVSIVVALVLAGSLLGVAVRAGASGAAGADARPTIKVIVVLKSRGDPGEVISKLTHDRAAAVYRYRYFSSVAATVSRATLGALLRDGNVADVVSDRKVRAPTTPATGATKALAGGGSKVAPARAGASTAPLESEALQLTHAQDAWAIRVKGHAVKGQGIRVGMLDTGTDPSHPDLAAAIADYRDFTGDGLRDSDGHGTATSSCVAAQGKLVYNSSTGTSMRIEGMAPGAKVVMAKVLDVSGGWDSNIMRGLEWLISQKVDIVSCSLGDAYIPPNGADPLAQAFQTAIDNGITVINSEGNEGPGQGTEGSAPDLKTVLAVGATTGYRLFSQIDYLATGNAYRGDQVIAWSSRGPNSLGDFRPDVMGFGAWGWALAPSGAGDAYGDVGTQVFGGTSMACPVVAGDLALAESAWKLAHPGQSLPAPAYWKALLADTATDLGYPAVDQSSGLVNAAAAVRAVLGQGKSFRATVSADPTSPTSWSPRIAAGARATTTISIKNTGSATERVVLAPRSFATFHTLDFKPIVVSAPDYTAVERFTVPAGTQFLRVRLTWPSGPNVSLDSAVYDSRGDLVSYGQTSGGYGHLSLAEISLTGPAAQRPVVVKGRPWRVDIFPASGLAPGAPQTVNLRVTYTRQTATRVIALARRAVTLKPGRSTRVAATVTAPALAGTWIYAIAVGNGGATTTIPVAVRVPVTLSDGRGSFRGTLNGSTVEYSGGELYFYDVHVPAGTRSLTASLEWPDAGNLVDLYLIDPNGDLRDAKGGDLLWYPDYSSFTVPDQAFGHRAEQVVWDAPEAGVWQVIVWGAGFNGRSFGEPYSGAVTLDTPVVAPADLTATTAPGTQVSTDFTIANGGQTTLSAYAESQATSAGTALYDDVALAPIGGTLAPTISGISPVATFTLPQDVTLVTAQATWTGPDTLVDLGLYDPSQTDKSEGLALSSAGNAVVVAHPMAGLWTLIAGYGDPSTSAASVAYSVSVDYVAPRPVAGFASSATAAAPLQIAAGASGSVRVTVDVPADAQPGSTITGTLHFFTVGDGTQAEGGDHLGSVPVTITVGAPG
jgi:Subtilase family